jgi:hypothetical protein
LLLQVWLEDALLASARPCYRGAIDDLQFDDLLFQQLQRPPPATLWRFGTSQGDQFGFGGSVKDALSGRGWRMLADQNGFKSLFHQLLAGPRNRIDAGVEGRRDLAIALSFASCRGARLLQDAGLDELAGRMLSGMCQRGETLPLLIAELHLYSFTAICFAVTKHLRRCGDIDSEIH